MAAWDLQEHDHRRAAMMATRAAILPYIRDCLDLTMPWRSDRRGQGGQGFERLFDGTGPVSTQRGAARLQRDLTPPFQRWFELEAGPLVPDGQVEAINRGLETSTMVCHSTLDATSFHGASMEAYSDLLVGTGALLGMEGDDDTLINWKAAPAWSLAFEEGPSGRVDNVIWEQPMEAWKLRRLWPGAQWSDAIRTKIIGSPATKIPIRQVSYYDPEVRRWRVEVLQADGSDKRVVWQTDKDRTNPWIVFRYWTTPGDPWGRGPVMLSLPDIRTANKTVEMILRAAAYSLAPPLMVLHDGVVNPDTLRLAPQSIIRVARTGGNLGRSIEPLNVGANVNLAQIALEEMRQNIKGNLLDTQLPPAAGAVRSASEIIERTKALQYDAGAAFGRLNHEYVPQVVARVMDILDRKKMPFINWDAMKIDHLLLKVKVTSPLARGQNLEDVQVIVQFWELAKTLGGEEAFLHVCNTSDGLPKIAKLMGAPLWAVNDGPTRRAMAKAAGQMAANVMQNGGGGPAGGGLPMGPAQAPLTGIAPPTIGVSA